MKAMTLAKLDISVNAEMARELARSVEGGEFPSIQAAVGDALRRWVDERQKRSGRLAFVRRRIQDSLADPGADLTGAEVDERLNALFAAAGRRDETP